MGAVNLDQQPEDEASRSDCVGSVDKVDDELPIFGVGHWNDNKLRSVHRDSNDGKRDLTHQ